jgi:hypothetical protein
VHRIQQPTWSAALNLRGAQWAKGQRRYPASQAVQGLRGGEDIRGAGQDELSGPAVPVDDPLQCQGDLWQALYFVDHHGKTGVRCLRGHGGELTERVQRQGRQQGLVVEGQEAGRLKHVPNEGGLAGLAGADDVDHPAGLQRSGHFAGQVAGNQVHFQPIREKGYYLYHDSAVSDKENRLLDI